MGKSVWVLGMASTMTPASERPKRAQPTLILLYPIPILHKKPPLPASPRRLFVQGRDFLGKANEGA
jgi:hypothetical protein